MLVKTQSQQPQTDSCVEELTTASEPGTSITASKELRKQHKQNTRVPTPEGGSESVPAWPAISSGGPVLVQTGQLQEGHFNLKLCLFGKVLIYREDVQHVCKGNRRGQRCFAVPSRRSVWKAHLICLLHNRIWNVPALNEILATKGLGIFWARKAGLVPVYVLEGDSFPKVTEVKQKWEYKQFKTWGKEKQYKIYSHIESGRVQLHVYIQSNVFRAIHIFLITLHN